MTKGIIIFPERVWEPLKDGDIVTWVTRPSTMDDILDRRQLAKKLNCDYVMARTQAGADSAKP